MDQCAGGFEQAPGNCFDDPNNTFQLVPYNQALNLGGATFTVPPPPSNGGPQNTLGAAITTPTASNVFSSVIYNNTVENTGQVLSFLLYACVPDGTSDESVIASTLFDTLIEVDLLDASGNTITTLFTATFENTINSTDLSCVWSRVTAPVGNLLPLGSPFKVAAFTTWFADKQPALVMIAVADDFTFTCPNGVSATATSPPPPAPPAPRPPSPPCSSWWKKHDNKKNKWHKKQYSSGRKLAM